MTESNLILYTTENGQTSVRLYASDGTVWLTQAQMAELFDTTPQNITLHLKAIYAENELALEATCKNYLQVQTEGKRAVQRKMKMYSLDAILAVGMRVRSVRGTQFRQWAIAHLKEYLVKGFVLDDERLKGSEKLDYFDELLQRIRDIRASEKRFYQKIRDLFALSCDYKGKEDETADFFATVQNKLLYAVTEQTAAELIISRADTAQPNMNLKSWSGNIVRKTDIYIAKNYLTQDEVGSLNELVVMFLDYAEHRAKNKQTIFLKDWQEYVDKFVAFNEHPLLKNAGSVSHDKMKEIVSERYEQFDTARKEQARLAADAQDCEEIKALEQAEQVLTVTRKKLKKS